jgi:hypothetical protein
LLIAEKKIGGHTITGTRIWCDRAPYDVAEAQETVERLVEHFLSDPAPSKGLIHFTMQKNLLPCSLVISKISAIEPHVQK